jgi:hypothetical protein
MNKEEVIRVKHDGIERNGFIVALENGEALYSYNVLEELEANPDVKILGFTSLDVDIESNSDSNQDEWQSVGQDGQWHNVGEVQKDETSSVEASETPPESEYSSENDGQQTEEAFKEVPEKSEGDTEIPETTSSDEDEYKLPSEILDNIDELLFSKLNTEIETDANLSNPTVRLMYSQQKSTLGTLLLLLGKSTEKDKAEARKLYVDYLNNSFYQEHQEEIDALLNNANENISISRQVEAIKNLLLEEYRQQKDAYLEEVFVRESQNYDSLNLPTLQENMEQEEQRLFSGIRESNIEAGYLADTLNELAITEFANEDSTPESIAKMLRFVDTKKEYAEFIEQAEMIQPQIQQATQPQSLQSNVEDIQEVSVESSSEEDAERHTTVESVEDEVESTSEETHHEEEHEIEESEKENESEDVDDPDEEDEDDDDSEDAEDEEDEESESKDTKEDKSKSKTGIKELFLNIFGKKTKEKSNSDEDEEDLEDFDDPDEEDEDDDEDEELVEVKKSQKGEGASSKNEKPKFPLIPAIATGITVLVLISGTAIWFAMQGNSNQKQRNTQQTTQTATVKSDSSNTSNEYTAKNHYGFKVGDSVDVTVSGSSANATITEFDNDGNALATTSGGKTILIKSETLKSARESKTGVFK